MCNLFIYYSQKVRRLIQRSLSITQTHFLPHVKSSVEIVDFLHEIIDTISTSLSSAFPEVESSKNETVSIVALEVLRYLDILKSIANTKNLHPDIPPLLLAGFPNLNKLSINDIEKVKTAGKIDGKTAYVW